MKLLIMIVHNKNWITLNLFFNIRSHNGSVFDSTLIMAYFHIKFKKKVNFAGLFSFKNYQLMRVTDSLYRPSGRVCETRQMPKSALDVDLDMVVGTRRVPSALHFGWTETHGVCLLLCIRISLY